MSRRSDPDGAKHGNAFDGTSVLIAGGAPVERRTTSPPSSPTNRMLYPASRNDLNQQPYNSFPQTAASLVSHRDYLNQQERNPTNKTKDPAQTSPRNASLSARAPASPSPPQQPQSYKKTDRTGKVYNVVDLDVSVLGDVDSLIEAPSSPTTSSRTSTSYYATSSTQPHRNSANGPQQPRLSPSSSSSRNNTTSPPPPPSAHLLSFKDQARSVRTITADRVEALPDLGADWQQASANAHSDRYRHAAATSSTTPARRRDTPVPVYNDPRQHQQPTSPATSSHRSTSPLWNDTTPAPPPQRQTSHRTPDETVFSFAVPKESKGCGCVIQ